MYRDKSYLSPGPAFWPVEDGEVFKPSMPCSISCTSSMSSPAGSEDLEMWSIGSKSTPCCDSKDSYFLRRSMSSFSWGFFFRRRGGWGATTLQLTPALTQLAHGFCLSQRTLRC